MEANLRQDLPPPVPFLDLAAESQDCTDSSTRSSYSSVEEESALTVGDLKDAFLRHTQNLTPDKSITWTDEKHNLYLSHLESSFIEQLHRSMGFSRRQLEQETEVGNVSRKLSANEQHTSEQLMVLQEHNLVPSGNMCVGRKRIFSNESETSSDNIPVSLHTQDESDGCLEEFSDQNFVEDVTEKSSTFISKRSKPCVADASSQDQIVPAPGHKSSRN